MKDKIYTWLSRFFLLLAVISTIFIGIWFQDTYMSQSELIKIDDEVVAGVIENSEDNTQKENDLPFVDVDFTDLKKRNSDIVGWLKVDAVNINIPIVQTTDNDFYLSHDIDKKPNQLGWVFVDARNDLEFMGTNTVLYGHNASNKQMFGSLKDIFEVKKDEVDKAKIIQLTTPSKQRVFEIVSVYVTTYEDWEYVKVYFDGYEDKKKFVDRLVSKNKMPIFKNHLINTNDNFLTFSTCYGQAGTDKRLVIHARLIGERDAN